MSRKGKGKSKTEELERRCVCIPTYLVRQIGLINRPFGNPLLCTAVSKCHAATFGQFSSYIRENKIAESPLPNPNPPIRSNAVSFTDIDVRTGAAEIGLPGPFKSGHVIPANTSQIGLGKRKGSPNSGEIEKEDSKEGGALKSVKDPNALQAFLHPLPPKVSKKSEASQSGSGVATAASDQVDVEEKGHVDVNDADNIGTLIGHKETTNDPGIQKVEEESTSATSPINRVCLIS